MSGDANRFFIRPYHPADADALLALFKDTIRRVNCRDYCPAQIAAWTSEIRPEVWAAKLATRWCVVAEMRNGELGGFVDLEVALATPTRGVHLDRFYVSADQQRCGVGRALLSAAVDKSLGLKVPRIFTEVSITARPFFLSQGFRVITDQLVFSRGAAFLNYRMELLSPFRPSIGHSVTDASHGVTGSTRTVRP